jgi:hypothetical protein
VSELQPTNSFPTSSSSLLWMFLWTMVVGHNHHYSWELEIPSFHFIHVESNYNNVHPRNEGLWSSFGLTMKNTKWWIPCAN